MVTPQPTQRADRQGDQLFLVGLLSFLIGHLCYSIAMLRYGTDRLSVGFGMILVLIALLAFGYRIIAGAHAAGGAVLTCGVTAYIAALGSAVVLGVGTTQLPIAYGIVLFAVSDLLLASDRFVQQRSWSPIAVITTYHAAQVLLLVGLLR
ncbi:MAG: lysoplasmalogenase family protein [Jatrophihabitantaceae bacterium]